MDIRFVITVVMLIVSIVNDYRNRKIKNIIPLTGIVLGIILNLFYKDTNILLSLLISAIYFIFLYFIPHSFNINEVMGAGDIKLYMAISFLMGWKFSIYSFIYSIGIGAVLLCILNYKRIKEILINTGMFFITRGKWNIDESQERTNIFTPYILLGCILEQILQYNWLKI